METRVGAPGDPKEKHLTKGAADKALRKACAELGIQGASTHQLAPHESVERERRKH